LVITTGVTSTFRNPHIYEKYYYYLTHTRCAPWFIGVILGYYIFQLKQNKFRLKLNKNLVWIIWAVCLGTMLTCVLGGFHSLRGEEYDRWGNAFHIALARPVWSLAVSWIILACTNDYGGEKTNTTKNQNQQKCFQVLLTGYFHSLSSKYLTDLSIVYT
jgi:peptidoglycan/LPS O-acetylase OafA/YrhL